MLWGSRIFSFGQVFLFSWEALFSSYLVFVCKIISVLVLVHVMATILILIHENNTAWYFANLHHFKVLGCEDGSPVATNVVVGVVIRFSNHSTKTFPFLNQSQLNFGYWLVIVFPFLYHVGFLSATWFVSSKILEIFRWNLHLANRNEMHIQGPTTVVLVCFLPQHMIIGIGDGGKGGHVPPPPNLGKKFLRQLLRKIWAFSGKNYVNVGDFVNIRANIKIRVFW